LSISGIIEEFRVRGLARAASHTETLAAANITTGQDSGRLVAFHPGTGRTADDAIVVYRVATQQVKPSALTIDVRDLNRDAFRVPLPPSLVIDDVLFVGDPNEGVQFTIRNQWAAPVPVTFHVVSMRISALQDLLAVVRR
jgi:hypothetical protein